MKRIFSKASPTDGEDKKTTGKRPVKIRPVILLVLTLAAAGAVIYLNISNNNKPPELKTVIVSRGEIESIVSVSGVVESEDSRVYYAPLKAKVDHVSVETGDIVRKGDVLITYDTKDLEYTKNERDLEAKAGENSYLSAMAEHEKNQNKFDYSVTRLEEIENYIDAEQAYIDALKDQIKDSQALERIKLIEERYSIQRQQNGVSVNMQIKPDGKITDSMYSAEYELKNRMDEISKKLDKIELKDEYRELEKQIVREQERLSDLEELKSELKADKNSAEAGILNSYKRDELKFTDEKIRISAQKAQDDLDEALEGVSADFNGIVTELYVHDGFVTDQSSKLLCLESIEDVRVSIFLSKYDLEKVRVGQEAEVHIAGRDYRGHVSKINHMAQKNDAGARLVAAQIHIDDADENIYLGIEGKTEIHAQKSENALLIPFSAVNTDQEGDFCYVIRDGIIERRKLEIGITSEDMMEVLTGLSEGDAVVTDAGESVKNGMKAEQSPMMGSMMERVRQSTVYGSGTDGT